MTAETLFDWRAERDAAMAQVAENAGEAFAFEFRTFVLDYLAVHGSATGETLTDSAKVKGIIAHSDKATGPVIAALSRAKLITSCGFAPRLKGHGSGGAHIWRLSTL